MTLLFPELKERLKQVDEISLLERLDISSEDIIEAFEEKIEERYEELCQEFQIDYRRG